VISVSRKSSAGLVDSSNDFAVYCLNFIDQMATPNYVLTDQDILRSRVKTTSITEKTFSNMLYMCLPYPLKAKGTTTIHSSYTLCVL
jgi:hypothetical protein